MPNKIDDFDLDVFDLEAEEQEPKTEEPQKTEIKEVATKKPADLDFSRIFSDFGTDVSKTPGVLVGAIGLQVSRFPIERIKFSQEKRDRISILSPNVIAIKTHYIEGIGTFLCFGGACCKIGDTPRVKYLFPVIVYTTDKKGRPITQDIELKVLAVGQEQYDSIQMIQEEVGDITSIDLIVSCSDSEYQKASYTQTKEALWKKSSKARDYILKEWPKVKDHIVDPIARSLTESQFKEKMRSIQTDRGTSLASEKSIDSVFEDDTE